MVIKPNENIVVTLNSTNISGGSIILKQSSDAISLSVNVTLKTATSRFFVIGTANDDLSPSISGACMQAVIHGTNGNPEGGAILEFSQKDVLVITNDIIPAGYSVRCKGSFVL